MFTISVRPINEELRVSVISTDWQVAIDPAFTDDKLVLTDLNNSEELFTKTFDLPLRPNDVYYVRYRFNYSDNTETDWEQPILVTYNSKGFSLGNLVIATPGIWLNVNPNQVYIKEFTINCDPFVVLIGNSEYKSTDWVIEDLDGNIVWSYMNDTTGSNSITVTDAKLLPNTVYLAKVRHNSVTNMSSNFGKLYFRTADSAISDDLVPADDVITMLVSTAIYATLKTEDDNTDNTVSTVQ